MGFDTRKQFHTVVSEQKFHLILWSRILIAQTAYFPIHGPATDQLNIHRHHSNVSQFSFSLLSLSPIFVFRNLNTASIASGFCHLYSKMYFLQLRSMFRTRNSQKFIIGEKITADTRVNSEYILPSSQSHGIKRCKGKMSPFAWQKMTLFCFHLLHIL